MHEFGLCEGIVEAIARRAAGRRAVRACVRAGAFLRIVDGPFRQAFERAANGSVAENAVVELKVVPALALCRDCHKQSEMYDPVEVCRHCGGTDLALTGGDELVLESIEYAEP